MDFTDTFEKCSRMILVKMVWEGKVIFARKPCSKF